MPIRRIARPARSDRIGGKWAVLIVLLLGEEPMRFNQ